jgi:hypothetical protein
MNIRPPLMPGLDTNVLARCIVDDDPRHAGQCGSAGRVPMITFDETAARLQNLELLKT